MDSINVPLNFHLNVRKSSEASLDLVQHAKNAIFQWLVNR